MDFGKRLPVESERPTPVIQETCVRCCGTGRVRERGDRFRCKTCNGTGRVTAQADIET